MTASHATAGLDLVKRLRQLELREAPINEKHCRGTGNRMPDPELEARRQNAGK